MHVNDLFDIKGKIAVVTGGGRGIGKFIAKGLAEAGADLVIASRKLGNLEETSKELEALGVKCYPFKCDMANEEDIHNLTNFAVKTYGTIDILVNNSGMTWGAPTLEYPLDKWDMIFDVNVRGVWILTQDVARIMKEKGGGKIINVSSFYSFRGAFEEVHPAIAYNSSKAAINLLTMNLAAKLAKYNIYVNAIAPGFFHTDMMKYLWQPEMKSLLDATLSQVPLARPGEEDDVKALAVFHASSASDYITGTIIPVDGGLLAK
ncbi:MAG: gluconate 5-dehydrogenase [Deltaproteobacteria bacterium]|nr:MAG: gluconate 5-dehydrogenase [Deltaproteobacteria bacterium]